MSEYQIFVNVSQQGGKILTLKVESNFTIENVKKLIKKDLYFPVDEQRLVYAGKGLENGKTLEDYGIGKESTLHIILGRLKTMVRRGPIDERASKFFQENEDIGYLAHFTDVHIQNTYLEGSNPDCDLKKFECCCFSKSKIQSRTAGKYGYMNRSDHLNMCDAPKLTFEETFQLLLDIPSIYNISLLGIVFGGDIPAHTHNQTLKNNMNHFNYFYNYIKKSLEKEEDIQFFPTIGNHDSYPKDNFSFPGGYSDWLYSNYSHWFSFFLDSKATEQVNRTGCYSSYIGLETNKLKLISLNSNLNNPINPYVRQSKSKDLHFIANFLENELNIAKEKNEKVIITQHITLRYDLLWNTQEWLDDYRRLATEFQDIIILDITGHFHLDYPTMILDEKQNPVLTQLTLNSVPPWYVKVQPAVRLFKIDMKKKEILDYIQIYNDLEKSNLEEKMSSNWNTLYTAKENFELEDLSPKSWWNFLDRIEQDDEIYLKFLNALHVGYLKGEYMKGKQKKETICSLKYVDKKNYDLCISTK